MDVEVPRRLENEMAGAALEALLSSRAVSISDSSSVDEANEESLMIKLLKLGRFVSSSVIVEPNIMIITLFHLPSSLHVANKPGNAEHGHKTQNQKPKHKTQNSNSTNTAVDELKKLKLLHHGPAIL
jgi:hypothetical protein